MPEVPKSAMDALEASIHSSETWVIVFGVVVAIGIVGEVGFGLKTFFLNKTFRIEQRADEQRSREKIASLTADTENARKSAAEANEKTEKLRESNARLELIIEALKRQRRLTEEQQRSVRTALKGVAGDFDMKLSVASVEDVEAQRYAIDFMELFASMGIRLVNRVSPALFPHPIIQSKPSPTEIVLLLKNAQKPPAIGKRLLHALTGAGLDVRTESAPDLMFGEIQIAVLSKHFPDTPQ